MRLTRLTPAVIEDRAETESSGRKEDVLLRVEGLECRFGPIRAVDGVTFNVRRGQLVGLIGPNGAGKSTLIQVVSGAQRATRGSVHFKGRNITGYSLDRVAAAGLVRTFQAPRVFGRLSLLSNLMVAAPGQRGEHVVAALLGLGGQQQRVNLGVAQGILETLGMLGKENEYAGQLSGGQQRLAELGRVLMMRPAMILLDEPFAGVSPSARRALAEILVGLVRDQGITILMVEHSMAMVEAVCSDVLVMDHGQVLARGSLSELRRDPEVVKAYLNA